MFGNLGLSEMVVICAIVLLVFGPDRLPGIAHRLGKVILQLRRTASDMRETVEREVRASEFRGAMEELRATGRVADRVLVPVAGAVAVTPPGDALIPPAGDGRGIFPDPQEGAGPPPIPEGTEAVDTLADPAAAGRR